MPVQPYLGFMCVPLLHSLHPYLGAILLFSVEESSQALETGRGPWRLFLPVGLTWAIHLQAYLFLRVLLL